MMQTGYLYTEEPEKQHRKGWYSEPVMSVAQELLLHAEGQKLLVKELEKKGVAFECTETQDADTRLLSSKFKEE